MVFDDDANLYAATGTEGKIYKIPTTNLTNNVETESKDTETNNPTVLFDSDETNIVSLLFHQGYLYAGSDGKAIIFKMIY